MVCGLARVVAQGSRCRYRAVDVGGTDGPGDDAGGGQPVDSEPPPAYRLWLIGVRADDLQLSTGTQADEEIRGAHPLMAAATRWLRPCESGEPRDRLCQAARHPHTQCGRSRSGIHVGLGVGDWCVALISPDSRLHPATIKPACLIEYAAADSAAIPSPDRHGRMRYRIAACLVNRRAVQIINMPIPPAFSVCTAAPRSALSQGDREAQRWRLGKAQAGGGWPSVRMTRPLKRPMRVALTDHLTGVRIRPRVKPSGMQLAVPSRRILLELRLRPRRWLLCRRV